LFDEKRNQKQTNKSVTPKNKLAFSVVSLQKQKQKSENILFVF
jgi:hypothetical protein